MNYERVIEIGPDYEKDGLNVHDVIMYEHYPDDTRKYIGKSTWATRIRRPAKILDFKPLREER